MEVSHVEVERRVSDPDAAPEALLAVAGDRRLEPRLRELAFNHPALTDDAALRLLEGGGVGAERFMAACERPALLAKLALEDDAHVRSLVAFNPATPTDVVHQLAQDVDAQVRASAVLNPQLSTEALATLLEDPDPDVRGWAHWALDSESGRRCRSGMRWATIDDTRA